MEPRLAPRERSFLMPYPDIAIRLLDLDGPRMARVERLLRHELKQQGIEARITCIGCGLEIARQGFAEMTPVLLMNQYAVIKGREITEADIGRFCRQLLVWRETVNRRGPATQHCGV